MTNFADARTLAVRGKIRMSASEAFVETLVANGVDTTFGIVGSAYMDAHDLFPLAGIRFVSVAHEQNAAHMADGYARVTGRPGVCIAQNGPGITNFVTAIAAAYWAHSPVVAITPEAGSTTMGLGGFQETEQLPIFSRITRYQVQVPGPARIAELTHRAFHLAQLERGPAQVNIPRDFFYGEVEVEIPKPLPIERAAGGPESLRRAARMLREARFPVIIAGGGVVMANGVAECVALAEQLGAPVVNSYLHNDSFPASHQLACGPLGYMGSKAAMNVINRADVVLALGSRLGPFGTLPQYGFDYFPVNARIIQVDADARMLGLVKKVELGICGDARAAAAELTRLLREGGAPIPRDEQRMTAIRAAKDAWSRELAAWPSPNEGDRMGPRQALSALQNALPRDVVVTTDIGNVCSVSNSYLAFERAPSFFAAMSFGNCGYAYPTAIGAKVGAPDRPCIAYVGDGAWGMSLAEVMTCVRENIPAIAVVFDNQQWGAEKKNQVDYFNDRYLGTNLVNPEFARVAESMGALGITCTRTDQVGDALATAVASNRPAVIVLKLTRELGDPFRRDAFRHPVRLLDKYKAHSYRKG